LVELWGAIGGALKFGKPYEIKRKFSKMMKPSLRILNKNLSMKIHHFSQSTTALLFQLVGAQKCCAFQWITWKTPSFCE
jgi:hypothetical protein